MGQSASSEDATQTEADVEDVAEDEDDGDDDDDETVAA